MQNNNNYKFIGVINTINIYPSFIYPVFEKDGKYYLQNGKNGIICSFREIPKELNSRITKLSDINLSTSPNIKYTYAIEDDPIICFRIDKVNFFISDMDNFASFIKNFETDDDMLKDEIDIFLDCVKINKSTRKIKKKTPQT